MQGLRTPFFVASCVALAAAVFLELGSNAIASHLQPFLGEAAGGREVATTWGLLSLAAIDALVVYGIGTMAAGLLLPRGGVARVQGLVALIGGLAGFAGALVAMFLMIALLLLMVGVLTAGPFGVIAYLVIWGGFPVDAARATIAAIMMCKLVFCVCLLVASPAFLGNKGLVVLVALSLLLTFLVGFLQEFPPSFLASITDAIGAIVSLVVAAVFMLLFAIGGLVAVVKAIGSARLPG